jgi:hypothetical protein
VGAEAVAKFLLNVRTRGPQNQQATIVTLNGKPALLLCDADTVPFTALMLEAVDGKIFALWGVADPEKLQRLVSATE